MERPWEYQAAIEAPAQIDGWLIALGTNRNVFGCTRLQFNKCPRPAPYFDTFLWRCAVVCLASLTGKSHLREAVKWRLVAEQFAVLQTFVKSHCFCHTRPNTESARQCWRLTGMPTALMPNKLYFSQNFKGCTNKEKSTLPLGIMPTRLNLTMIRHP